MGTVNTELNAKIIDANVAFYNSAFGKKVVNGDLVIYDSSAKLYMHVCGVVYDGVIYGVKRGDDPHDMNAYDVFDATSNGNDGQYTYVLPVTPNSVEQTVVENAKAYIRSHGTTLAYTYIHPLCTKCTNIPGHVYIPLYDSHRAVLYLGKGTYMKIAGDDALMTEVGHIYIHLATRVPTRMLDYGRSPLTTVDLMEMVDTSVVDNHVNSVDHGVKLTADKTTKQMVDLGQLVEVNGQYQVMVDGNVVGLFTPVEVKETVPRQKPLTPPKGMREFTVRVDLDYSTRKSSPWHCPLTADDPFVSANMPEQLDNVYRHMGKQLGSPRGLQHALTRYIKPEGKVVNVEYDIPDMTMGKGTVGVVVTYWARANMDKTITELVHIEKDNGHSKFHYYSQTYVHVYVVHDDAA